MKDMLTPTVVVELDIVEKNIKKMVENAGKNNITHRPHIKAHKSVYLAKKQLEYGCKGITCAKITEAEVMVANGITDILIAFPIIGKSKLEKLKALSTKCDVKTIVNSIEGAKGISDMGVELGTKMKLLIDVDGGIFRGGKEPGQPTLDFAMQIKDFEGIDICGIMYYGGDIYSKRLEEDIVERVKQERDEILYTKELLEGAGFDIRILSTGTSYSSKRTDYLQGITEIRAGNYIFNDNSQLSANLITEDDCGLRICSTVVSIVDDKNFIIDAGSKTLTSDTGVFTKGYGHIIGMANAIIHKLNEEHGFVKTETAHNLKIGDIVKIIPNHACVIPNLCDNVIGIRNGKFELDIKIDARGLNK